MMQRFHGERVVVTRALGQAGKLADLLEEWGAEPVVLPLIDVSSDEEGNRAEEVFAGLAIYEWIVFTSANGVRFFFEAFFERFRDLRCLGPCRIGCVGKATREAVESFHLEVDLEPEQATGEALGRAMLDFETLDGLKILVVTGNRNREKLPKMLEEVGHAIVDLFPVYRTELRDLSRDAGAASFRKAGADWITFTSSSTVEAFVEQAGNLLLESGARRPRTCSIGPVTSATMREKGIPVDLESPESSIPAMVAAIAAATNRGAGNE